MIKTTLKWHKPNPKDLPELIHGDYSEELIICVREENAEFGTIFFTAYFDDTLKFIVRGGVFTAFSLRDIQAWAYLPELDFMKGE